MKPSPPNRREPRKKRDLPSNKTASAIRENIPADGTPPNKGDLPMDETFPKVKEPPLNNTDPPPHQQDDPSHQQWDPQIPPITPAPKVPRKLSTRPRSHPDPNIPFPPKASNGAPFPSPIPPPPQQLPDAAILHLRCRPLQGRTEVPFPGGRRRWERGRRRRRERERNVRCQRRGEADGGEKAHFRPNARPFRFRAEETGKKGEISAFHWLRGGVFRSHPRPFRLF